MKKPTRPLTHRMIPGRYGRYADSHDILKLLSVKKLPAEGMPGRSLYGVWVYVKPLVCPVEQSGWNGRHMRRNWQGLRVMAMCACGQHVAVGRLHQHRCPVSPAAPGYEE